MVSPQLRRSFVLPAWTWMAFTLLIAAWLRVHLIERPEAFVDEGANILTALDSRVRTGFDPLAQGRPGLAWLFKPAGWVPQYALQTARLMSACAGLATVLSIGWTLYLLAGRLAAFYGMLIWAVMPLAIFHERLALQDPFITALLSAAVALFTTGSLRSKPSSGWPWFALAGIFFGVAFLQKVSAALALPWLAIVYLAVRHQVGRPLVDRNLWCIVLGALIPVTTLGSHLFELATQLNHYEATTFSHPAKFHPALNERLQTWFEYYHDFGRWPLLLLIAMALGLAFRAKDRLTIALGGAWLVVLLTTLALYNNMYARYILPDQIPLVLFLALGISKVGTLKMWKLSSAAIFLSLLPLISWTCTSRQIGTDPLRARISEREVAQYYTGPWSGCGLGPVREYLRNYSDLHHTTCVVFTYRFLRPGAYGLMLTELDDPRIVVIPFVIYGPNELESARTDIKRITDKHTSAYFILYEGSLYPANPWLDFPNTPTHLVYKVPRNDTDNFSLYQFVP